MESDENRLLSLRIEIDRDEHALRAEGQRFILHHGAELIDLGRQVADAAGAELVAAFREEVLWSRQRPDYWPLGPLVDLFRSARNVADLDRQRLETLLAGLLLLASNAATLIEMRATLAHANAEESKTLRKAPTPSILVRRPLFAGARKTPR